MKKLFIILLVVGITILSGCVNNLKPSQKIAIGGGTYDTDIETPHPYSNSDSGTKLVWSYILEDPNATSFRLHFKKVELVSSYKAYKDKEETQFRDIVKVEGLDWHYVNNIDTFPKDIERYAYNSVGDYILIRDANGEAQEIIRGLCPPPSLGFPTPCSEDGFWTGSLFGNKVTIELYADEKDNGFGLYIDKYARGFSEEERKIKNEEMIEQYYKECEEKGIPRDECLIPK